MDSWQLALAGSAALFATFMLWRMRPQLSTEGRATVGKLAEAKARVEDAKDDASRARALCDAAAATARLGKTGSAVALYLRAFRADPTAAYIVESAATCLSRRPRALEEMMWRILGGQPWTGEHRAPATLALETLGRIYDRKGSTKLRARALEHARELLAGGADEGAKAE